MSIPIAKTRPPIMARHMKITHAPATEQSCMMPTMRRNHIAGPLDRVNSFTQERVMMRMTTMTMESTLGTGTIKKSMHTKTMLKVITITIEATQEATINRIMMSEAMSTRKVEIKLLLTIMTKERDRATLRLHKLVAIETLITVGTRESQIRKGMR